MNFKKFLFYIPQPLLEEIRAIAVENSIPISAFIRQSLTRNIRAYKATEAAAMADAKAHPEGCEH